MMRSRSEIGELEQAIHAVGMEIAAALPLEKRHPLRRLEDALTGQMAQDRKLRAAIFRFVDVAPACRSLDDLGRHLLEHIEQLERPPGPFRSARRLARGPLSRRLLGLAARAGVRRMARRFIVGQTAGGALGLLGGLWRGGAAASLDLLGEETLTLAEADSYAARCEQALRALCAGAGQWPRQAQLEEDSLGRLPRANLSVKLTALTPLVRPHAPEVGERNAAPRLRSLLRLARELHAHLHIDMESLDTRETTLELVLALLAEKEFRSGPSAGIVLQAYLRDSPQELDRILGWAASNAREQPLVVRLVKGAYWDQEVALARHSGWLPPVFTDKAESDRSFEHLSRSLLEARPLVRVAIGSHNLRSIAHAVAFNRSLGESDRELELQVLRGLGDELQQALARLGFRVRVYCPVGDLVEGMAYLARRLLENTSNESFLYRQASGHDLDELLAAPRPAGPDLSEAAVRS